MGNFGQRVLNLLALIPHPTYGNYGGNYNGCKEGVCKEPIDPLDEVYRRHDLDMHSKDMLENIWKVKTSQMEQPVWGSVHRVMVTIFFWPLVKLKIIE